MTCYDDESDAKGSLLRVQKHSVKLNTLIVMLAEYIQQGALDANGGEKYLKQIEVKCGVHEKLRSHIRAGANNSGFGATLQQAPRTELQKKQEL